MSRINRTQVRGWNTSVYKHTRWLGDEADEEHANPIMAAKRNPDVLSDEQKVWYDSDYDAYYQHCLRNQRLCRTLATIIPKLTKKQTRS